MKVVSDMSLMRQSELRILAVDDRIRGVLQSESTSKGKGKKGKGKTKMFDPQELGSLYKDHSGPSSEEQVGGLMSKDVRPQRTWREREKVRQRQRQEQSTKHIFCRQEQGKEYGQRQTIIRPSLHEKGPRQRQKEERFHRWRSNKRQRSAW